MKMMILWKCQENINNKIVCMLKSRCIFSLLINTFFIHVLI